MAPFVDQCVGSSWFSNRFLGVTPSSAAILNVVWVVFSTPTLLSTRTETGSTNFGFISYQPNLVAMQFGFSQMLPKSLYTWENDICGLEINNFVQEYGYYMSFQH